MHDLEVRINQIDYVGFLKQPAFSLWGEGKILLAALHGAYQPYNVKLADIIAAGDGDSPGVQGVSVKLGSGGFFRFKFDKVEARLSNYLETDLVRFPDVIERGVSGIRNAATDFSFSSHLLVHFNHSVISGVTSKEFLKVLEPQPNLAIGESRGHGFIFNFDLSERGWQVQLSVDHSFTITDGIYIHFTVIINSDRIDYEQVLTDAREVFNRCLGELGLRIQKAV